MRRRPTQFSGGEVAEYVCPGCKEKDMAKVPNRSFRFTIECPCGYRIQLANVEGQGWVTVEIPE